MRVQCPAYICRSHVYTQQFEELRPEYCYGLQQLRQFNSIKCNMRDEHKKKVL